MKEVNLINPNQSEAMYRVLFIGFDFDCGTKLGKSKDKRLVAIYLTKKEVEKYFNKRGLEGEK